MKNIFVFVLLVLFSCAKVQVPSAGQKPSGGTSSDQKEEVYTIFGFVCDMEGNALPDVVVSDGFTSAKTNAEGEYRINSDLQKVKFVYLSQPSGYRSPVRNGQSTFHKLLRGEGVMVDGGKFRVDFALEKIIENPDKYTILFIGDPQSRNVTAGYDNIGYHSTECVDELFWDLKEYTSTISGSNVCGVVLGDIVHETMTLYDHFSNHLKALDYPTYCVIGNHDNDPNASDDTDGAAYFEQYFGPRNYSFNIGKIHVVVLDNLIMKHNSDGKLKSYNQGLTDEIWQWLVSDLKFVDHSSTVMVCSHSPMFRLPSGSDRFASSSTRHGSDYATLLSLYDKVYAWAGHSHNMFNYVPSSGIYKNIESHTVSRATGGLWTNEWINTDGTPRGYVVVDIDGDDISWHFKPMPYQPDPAVSKVPAYKYMKVNDNVVYVNGEKMGPSYQMRAYPRGEYGDNNIYVNIFMWDDLWEKPVFTDSDGQTTAMSPVTSSKYKYDMASVEIYDFYKANSSKLSADSSYDYDTDVAHIFRCTTDKSTGSGTVTVKDRFGNVYSTSVSW